MFATLTVEPLTATIGAELDGVDLADDLSDETIAEIRRALLEWKVVFFRDQHRLGRDEHVAFGRRFGDLEVHPLTPDDQDHPEVFVLPSGGERRAPGLWHSDVTWRPEPSMGSILRSVELPPVGGDTLWADMHAAHDLLDDGMKARVADLVALHDYTRVFGAAASPDAQERMRAEHPTVEHPIVRTHPETGRKAIYVNAAFTCGIKGMDGAEARAILSKLERQAWLPDVQCRFRWQPGSVAFWDNRSTQHCVSNDFLPHRRVMERVTVVGDRPF
ncbi:MAG: TauD/TfdA dioxygenase family protein [Acidimicrobiia bacterium]